jgi:hypothetical protein
VQFARCSLASIGAACVVACASSSPPPVVAAPPDGVSHVDRVARACAKIASCAHAHDAPRDRDPSACVDGWLARARPNDAAFLRCVSSAASCGALDACAKERGGDAIAAAYCRAHPGEPTACDDARLVICADDDLAESRSIDCAALSATCGESHAGGLVTRGCMSPTLCPAGAPDARCDGDAIVTCRDGAAERTACTKGRCVEHRGDTRSAMCESPGHDHCDDVGRSRCEGGMLVQCVPHGPLGERRVVDCGALGLACDGSSAKAVCALPGQRSCEAGAPRCRGDALAFCAAGRPFEVKCAEIGFARCDPDGHGLEASCGTAR